MKNVADCLVAILQSDAYAETTKFDKRGHILVDGAVIFLLMLCSGVLLCGKVTPYTDMIPSIVVSLMIAVLFSYSLIDLLKQQKPAKPIFYGSGIVEKIYEEPLCSRDSLIDRSRFSYGVKLKLSNRVDVPVGLLHMYEGRKCSNKNQYKVGDEVLFFQTESTIYCAGLTEQE